jgi:PIN domain nuclease of toxin-antitoxin system
MTVDTHVLIWYAEDNPLLRLDIRDRLRDHSRGVYVSSIVLWELALLVEKKRIDAKGQTPEQYARGLFERSGFREAPLTGNMAVLSRTLPFVHDDPADRFIAATAISLNLPLVTYDQNLIRLSWLKTVS